MYCAILCLDNERRSALRGGRKQAGGSGAPGEVRTHDLQLRRLSLYPSELRAHWLTAKRAIEAP